MACLINCSMGVNHGGTGERVPQNLEWATLMQIPQILSCLKILSIRVLALQCCKKRTNFMTPTEYFIHYFPKVQRSPNHHFRPKIQHFSGEDTDKNTYQNAPKHAISSENSFFLRNWPILFVRLLMPV